METGVDGGIILKKIVEEMDANFWTRFNWQVFVKVVISLVALYKQKSHRLSE